MVRNDDNGWAIDPVRPLALAASWSLFAEQQSSRIETARFAASATRFFACDLRVIDHKQYPGGAEPRADQAEIALAWRGRASRVRVINCAVDAAPELCAAAAAVAGGGLERLVAKAKRLWQVEAAPIEGDEHGPLLATAILASVLLAPILPPTGDAVFGVKGARERLGG